MDGWKSQIEHEHPCWDGYRALLERLPAENFPGSALLNGLLPPGLENAAGKVIRFRTSAELPGVAYEKHIFETGEVSTREEHWHDLFNALVWCRLPLLKVAMNAVHYDHIEEEENGRRGGQRDALTLLDECGVIVTGPEAGLLEALAAREWRPAFVDYRDAWKETRVLVCGHAILEKFLTPYKSVTAHAVYLHNSEPMAIEEIDNLLAETLLEGALMSSPKDLLPLPLMGIPGWWPFGAQDTAFYADKAVFRPPAE
jgi:hypothetical protein